jgi:hypothetical protein
MLRKPIVLVMAIIFVRPVGCSIMVAVMVNRGNIVVQVLEENWVIGERIEGGRC